MANAVQGRQRAESERQIMSAWWSTRIRSDAESKGGVRLRDYLEELLPDQERADREAERLIAKWDALSVQSTQQGKGAD